MSRRKTIGFLAGIGATALLAACGGSPSANSSGTMSSSLASSAATSATVSSSAAARSSGTSGTVTGTTTAAPLSGSATMSATSSAQARTAASAASATESGAVAFNIPATKLPASKVTLHWVDSGDQKAVFFKQFFAAYHDQHPNVTVDYTPLPWNQIAQVVPLGVRSGNAPDVFELPLNITGPEAVRQGWVQPVQPFIADFDQWKQGYPAATFLPGITDFNGKTYGVPFTTDKRQGKLLLYNVSLLQQAGYDPSKKPMTWDEFHTAAQKTTATGRGMSYGLILGGDQDSTWSGDVDVLAAMSGAFGGEMNYKTGEYGFTAPQYIAAINYLLSFKSFVFPGSEALNSPEARARVPQGAAAMMLQGPWNIPLWEHDDPSFDFGVASAPLPNDGHWYPISVAPGGADRWWLYAKSKNGEIVGDIFRYLGSLPGQTAWAQIDTVADPAIFPQALDTVIQSGRIDARKRSALQLNQQQVKVGPSPVVRNPDVEQVDLQLVTPEPTFAQVVHGLYTGQLNDVNQQMQQTKDRYEKALDTAIKAAQAKGAKVSRQDYVFPNWDPTKDYTAADYQALSK